MGQQHARRVGLAGLGAVGRCLARRLSEGLKGYTIGAVSARREAPARAFLDEIGCSAPLVPVEALAEHAEVVVEAVPASLFRSVLEPAIDHRRDAIVLSCGALLSNWDLVDRARRTGARIHVPSGAILGLDAVQAAAQGHIHSVTMVTRKPTAGLDGAPFIREQHLDLADAPEAVLVFQGTAREAVAGFPANLNVAAALSLAGVGPDETRLEVWADPSLDRNIHTVEVDSDSAQLSLRIANIPTEENSGTGRITALSVLALLHKLQSPLRIGT